MKDIRIKVIPQTHIEITNFLQMAVEWNVDRAEARDKMVIISLNRLYLRLMKKPIGAFILKIKPEEGLALFHFYNYMFDGTMVDTMLNPLMRTTLNDIRDEVHQTYLT